MVESAVMILHSLRAGSPVVTDPGCRPSAARGTTLAPLFGGRNPDQAFLNDRGDETAVTPEDLWPRASPRAPDAAGDSWRYSGQSSARNGSWNPTRRDPGRVRAAAGRRGCCRGPWGLRETPLTATRWSARKAAAASLMLGMAPPCSLPCSSPAGTADAAPEGSCPTATSAPYPAEEGPTVPTKPGPSAL
jgi:hypothetical protein